MNSVSVRDLRNHGGEVLDRVAKGETITITRNGKPVAELRPLPVAGTSSKLLIERWRHLPPVDPVKLRADIDAIIDSSL
jgi:prevent-host-death family protein